MNPIFVTGGAGFIGGCFVRQCVANDVPVVNLDALTYAGNLDSIDSVWDSELHNFVHGDIGDIKLVSSILHRHEPAAIVNFAAESHVDRSIDEPLEFVRTNVMGTCGLLESARRYWQSLPAGAKETFRFLHVSTDEVYGSLGPTGYFVESTPFSPNSPYSASKAASDHFVRAYHHTYGLPVLTTNCSNNYGPFQFPEKLIPLMIQNILAGKPLPIYGDGSNIRDWLYVEDHCEAISRVLKLGRVGETYNIGGNSERTNLEVVNTICRIIDELRPGLPHGPSESLITFVDDRPGHDQRYAVDASKLHDETGWLPAHSFEDGIRKTVAWYLEHASWVERVCDGTYQQERLGLTTV